jgi:UTP--glucose-1-phosphate uridylyltransferase
VSIGDWQPAAALLPRYLEKMRADDLPDYVQRSFTYYFELLCAQQTGIMRESEISPVGESSVARFDALAEYRQAGADALSRASMAKLNGGLGTSMGLDRAKSLLEVKDGLSFLDITARQVEHFRATQGVPLPLVLMNSFSTEEDTRAALSGFSGNPPGIPLSFLQHRFPKVLVADGRPAEWPQNPQLEWNPPGHGEFYAALRSSGTLAALLDAGIEYLFVSNADNLGATLSLEILGYMAAGNLPFIMEVAERTANDRKGGHLALAADGRLTLRESAQCEPADADQFQDITRHRFFNTNNLWVNLRVLSNTLEQDEDQVPDLPMIRNEKRVDPTDGTSPAVYQLESAMGAAISLFDGAQAVVVPRSRFLPVKKTSDLLLIRSDCYRLESDYTLTEARPEGIGPCIVDLDGSVYGRINDFDQRFAAGAPSLRGCSSLSIAGDVSFGRDVRCLHDVELRNTGSGQARVEDGTTLEGTVRY